MHIPSRWRNVTVMIKSDKKLTDRVLPSILLNQDILYGTYGRCQEK